MRETPREFTARTGLAYDPPDFVRRQARALGPDEALPTLFRFPGPRGLFDHFLDTVKHLAPVPDGELWASADPLRDAPGAAHFGTVALLQPLAFSFAPDANGHFVGVNRVANPDHVVWIPPSRLRAAIPWDALATADAARTHLGNTDRERAAVLESLAAYLEELEAITHAGFPDPNLPWCDRPREQRQQMLAAAALPAPWTTK